MSNVQLRGLGATGPHGSLAFSPLSVSATVRTPKTPKMRERNLELFLLVLGGLAGTSIGVLYATNNTKLAGTLTMATGLMGTIYGAIRLLAMYDTEIAAEREAQGLPA